MTTIIFFCKYWRAILCPCVTSCAEKHLIPVLDGWWWAATTPCWMVLGREQQEHWPLQGDVSALHQAKQVLLHILINTSLFWCVKIYMCCWFLWKCLDLACYCQYSLLIEYVISRWHTGSGMGVLVENRYKMMTLQEDELGADLGWGHKLELFLLSQSCLTSCLCSAVLKDGETTPENTIWGIFKMSQLRTLVNHWLWWNSSFLSEKNHCCNFNFSLAVL